MNRFGRTWRTRSATPASASEAFGSQTQRTMVRATS